MRRRIYNILLTEDGKPLAGVPVFIRLSSPAWDTEGQRLIVGWGTVVYTDEAGRWEATVVANDSLSDPNTYYIIVENYNVVAKARSNTYKVRVPSTGYTEPICIKDILIG